MKKVASATLFALALLFSLVIGTQFVGLASANFHVPPSPVIEVQSPISIVNVPDVPLIVKAKVPSIGSGAGLEGIRWLNYSLDGQPAVQLTLEFQSEIKTMVNDTTNPFNGDPYKLYIAADTLRGVSDGRHYLTVQGESVFNKSLSVATTFVVDTVHPKIKVLSPLPNETYFSTNVTLAYQVGESISWAGYSLDGNINITSRINTTLTNLPYRTHVIRVYANDSAGNECFSPPIIFTVKDIDPPVISLLSTGSTYDTTDIPLNFAVNENVVWICYSLDDQANVTLAGNSTLTRLSSGSHKLTVYANDTAGNIGFSQTFNFTVADGSPQSAEPSPTTLVAIAAVSAVAIYGAGLLVYTKKRTHAANEVASPRQ